MATSGSFNTNTLKNSNYYFNWQQVSQNVTNNYTDIKWQAGINTGGNYWYNNAMKINNIYINGTKVFSGGTYSNIEGGSRQLASGTARIYHNTDGTKKFSASMSCWLYDYGNCSGSGSWTLTTIPRASQPSLITYPSSTQNIGKMGDTIKIHMNRASSSFTHTIYYQWGDSTKNEIANGVADNYQWTIPKSLASKIPTATSGSGAIVVDTYNGSTKIGTKTTSFTVSISDDMVPSFKSVSISEANDAPKLLGVYVQNMSALRVIIDGSGSYSSVISQCKVEGIDNAVYYAHDFTSANLLTAGDRTIKITLTDTRGRSTSTTRTYKCIPYQSAYISKIDILRCKADGTFSESGEYVKYTFKASASSIDNHNNIYFKLGYKLHGSDDPYTYISIADNTYNISKENVMINDVLFDEDLSYDFIFSVVDHFQTVSLLKTLGTAFSLINFNASGKGIAFGKVSEKDAFEVAMDVDITGSAKANGHVLQYSDTIQILDSSQLTINATAWTPFKLSLKNYRSSGSAFTFDNTNKAIVLNKSGIFDIDLNLNVYTSSGYVKHDYILYVYRNGYDAGCAGYVYLGDNSHYAQISGSIHGLACNAGDVLEMYVTVGATGTVKTFARENTSMIVKYRRPKDE